MKANIWSVSKTFPRKLYLPLSSVGLQSNNTPITNRHLLHQICLPSSASQSAFLLFIFKCRLSERWRMTINLFSISSASLNFAHTILWLKGIGLFSPWGKANISTTQISFWRAERRRFIDLDDERGKSRLSLRRPDLAKFRKTSALINISKLVTNKQARERFLWLAARGRSCRGLLSKPRHKIINFYSPLEAKRIKTVHANILWSLGKTLKC